MTIPPASRKTLLVEKKKYHRPPAIPKQIFEKLLRGYLQHPRNFDRKSLEYMYGPKYGSVPNLTSALPCLLNSPWPPVLKYYHNAVPQPNRHPRWLSSRESGSLGVPPQVTQRQRAARVHESGRVMRAGRTKRSNSFPDTNPSLIASSRNVVPLASADLAIFAALS